MVSSGHFLPDFRHLAPSSLPGAQLKLLIIIDDGDDQDADEDDANLGQLLVVDVQVTTKAAGVTTCAR